MDYFGLCGMIKFNLTLYLLAILNFVGFYEMIGWLGRKDSNLRVTGSKPVALPLGYVPIWRMPAKQGGVMPQKHANLLTRLSMDKK